IIVRCLSQRYNNVWINGGAVPSTEADGRAFSFDIIPSSQLDNIVIVKSPTPELPGDFSGGFIKITTKDVPDTDSFTIGVSTGGNIKTLSHNTRLPSGSSTDFLGFGAKYRSLSGDFPSNLATVTDATQNDYLQKNGFNNNWNVNEFRALPDMKLNFAWNTKVSQKINMSLSGGYSNTYKSYLGMERNRYGTYSASADAPVTEKSYTDNQYSNEVELNAMNNWIYRFDNYNSIEFRNLFNMSSTNSLVERYGLSTVSGDYYENQVEMQYTTRLTYTGQLSGSHTIGNDHSNTITWNGSYSFADENQPDRRIIDELGPVPSDGVIYANMPTAYNDKITRYTEELHDNIISGALDYKKSFDNGSWKPELRAGLYGETRSRDYQPREFVYRYDQLSYEDRLDYIYLPYQQMMSMDWIGSDKVYADEITSKANAYSGNNTIAAAYVSASLPLGKVNIYAGARVEYWNMNITYDRAISASQTLMTTNHYDELSILPSINAAYNFNEKHLLRLAYGRSVNRPEFREVSPSVYYDFDLFAEIQGNTSLEMATIDNIDLRWEFYPSSGEMLSVGAFYKYFKNPIEWNFVDMGGSYRYSYENAASAFVAGVEVDLRKSLDFIGVPELTLVLNGSFVVSQVSFSEGSLVTEKDRQLQGQSPYIVNAGLYYASSEKLGLSASVLYNVVGKRIMGVGKTTSTTGNTDYDIPDSYEMPRHLVDLTITKSIGEKVDMKLSVKDILSSPVVYKQFPTTTINGEQVTREQTTVSYTPGTSFSVGVSFKL
ncbi:MAG: outer membrane beta-barrel protein, partial [Rikenellaceae bacterium]